ncbi:glycosyltransferase family 2 protein [Bacteroides clarus]|uniref:glycosyltransferase family 2 protein n=1 Tax=Bacteroides clarus TaxID=626929 RepID=UPI0026670869|nr:glycosyltransferase family 2 protein [Bacteroides clarus]
MDEKYWKCQNAIKVSIIVPVYNVEDYIERCILSIMKQTYQNIECIIVDDCTPDNSVKIIQTLLYKYNGTVSFQLLRHANNKGLSASRNTGTKKATGDYIYYLDSDDELMPNCIEHLVNIAKTDTSIEIVQGNTKRFPEISNNDWYDISRYNLPTEFINNESIRNWFYNLNSPKPINAWNKLIKKEFLITYALFFEEGLIHEDELWMFYVTKFLKHIRFTNQITYKHYCTPNSIISTSSQQKSAYHIGKILRIITSSIDKKYFKQQYKFYLYYFAPRFINYPSLGEYPYLYKWFLKESITNRIYYYTFILFITFLLSIPHKGKTMILNLIKLYKI